VLSDLLLLAGIILIAIKFGLGARLREIARVLDRLVNVFLVLIVVAYALQVAFIFFFRRSP
jgi:hypothetical protein